MAKFKIQDGSIKEMGTSKVGMIVTFRSDDGGEATQYHEVESIDSSVIESELQKSADEFEARVKSHVDIPKMTTGEFMQADELI